MGNGIVETGRVLAVRAEAFTVLAGRADAGLVILCDHAANDVPVEYGTLGLPEAQLKRHIAYDIGAAAVTRLLAAELGVPAVLTHFSRLLIDPNRGLDDPTLIMRLSDGAIVPGNRSLDAAERQKRVSRYYRPYHAAVAAVLDQCQASGVAPAILSIHSFTESWKGLSRPWHAGVLRDEDPEFAPALLEALFAENDLIVGDNQPYSGWLEGDTLWQHGRQRGLARALIELRQDLIRDETGQRAWSARLVRLLRSLPQLPYLEEAGLQQPGRGSAEPSLAAARRRTNGTAHAGKQQTHEEPSVSIDAQTRTELEAAVYRTLVAHLVKRSDVQNIDLMTLAGFCRNCLANWYMEAAQSRGLSMSKDEAREIVYGMPYVEWQQRHQTAATPAQQAAFQKAHTHNH